MAKKTWFNHVDLAHEVPSVHSEHDALDEARGVERDPGDRRVRRPEGTHAVYEAPIPHNATATRDKIANRIYALRGESPVN